MAPCCTTKVFNHSYPHCWRHKTPIIFRATPSGSSAWSRRGLRKRALEEIERIEKEGIAQHGQSGWVPAWGQEPHPGDGREPS